MRHLPALLIAVDLLLGSAGPAFAARELKVVWSAEAAQLAKQSGLRWGAGLADDAAAAGGKALRTPYQPAAKGSSVNFGAPPMEMRGEVLFAVWLRAEKLPPLVPGFTVTLVAHDKKTGQWRIHRETRVYRANLSATGATSRAVFFGPCGTAPG